MENELIFVPVYNMLCLSLAVFLFATLLRLKSIVIDKKNKEGIQNSFNLCLRLTEFILISINH